MEQVLTAPAEREVLVETRTTSQPSDLAWWYMHNIIQSPNGDHPHVPATGLRPKIEEDDSWESEGWRYIETTTEEGRVTRVRVPLTRYELLHPKEDYVIVHKTPHGRNTTYISNTVGTHLAHDPKAFVFDDVRVDFNLLGAKPVSPDISVVLDVSEDKDWGTFECQEEGVYPSVVFEITSPGTRKSDFGEKYDYYRRAEVPYYVILDIIYDKNKRVSGYRLFVFELSGTQYIEMQPDHQGRYWLPPLGISVDVGDKGILCYDALGNLLMSHEEVTRAWNEAQEHAGEQKRIAQQESARAAEQERIAQQESARAAEQKQIAKQERMLAQQESARAAEQERIAQQESARAAEQEQIAEQERMLAQQESARAAEQKQIAKQERMLAQQEATRAAEQERIAQQESARAAEQERIAERERMLAQQESARAAEQEQIAEQERMLARQESARAAEQERIAQQEAARAAEAEAKVAELLARMAELEGKL